MSECINREVEGPACLSDPSLQIVLVVPEPSGVEQMLELAQSGMPDPICLVAWGLLACAVGAFLKWGSVRGIHH